MMKVFVTSNSGGQHKIVCLFPPPAGRNAGGKTWQEVLLAVGASGSTSIDGLLSDIERKEILSGALLEHTITIAGDNISNPMSAMARKQIKTEVADFIRELKRQYNYYGMSEKI